MQPKSLVLLALALGCGLVASIGITKVMANRDSEETLNPDMEKIYVALQEISTGTPITVEMIKLEEWPKGKVDGPLSQLEDVEGRMPRTRIYPGEPILDQKLLSKGDSSSGADVQIPIGYRVVPVRVSEETGGAAMILPGNRVDVLILAKVKVHFLSQQGRNFEKEITKTILQNIKIFAVDATWSLQAEDDGKTIRAKTISLLLTPSQTEKVALAGKVGTIFLALRSPEDDTVAELGKGVTIDDILDGMEIADKRKDDDLLYDEEDETQAEDSFLDMLAGGAGDGSGEFEASRPNRTWVMKTIRGDQVEDVVLELEEEMVIELVAEEESPDQWTGRAEPELEGAEEPGSFSFWKMVTSPNPLSDTATDQPEENPAAGETEQETPGREATEQDEEEETVLDESS